MRADTVKKMVDEADELRGLLHEAWDWIEEAAPMLAAYPTPAAVTRLQMEAEVLIKKIQRAL